MDNSPNSELSPTKKALLALKQMQQKLEALEREKYEPIAVIGMGFRFPGANNPEAFWELLNNATDAITEVPPQHWDAWQYYDRHFDTPGKICTVKGGFVPHLKEFDAAFFRISPREAASLDPQQRLLLEVSWEALENAAINPDYLKNSQTGVFIGICSTDYWHKLLNRQITDIDAYLTTGNTHSLASGRISHFLGLTGASISLDTACSSALVAVHLAIQSLRDRSCNMALVGGVNRLISPEVSINFTKAKMLSPDGRCQTFDDNANGFVRSEGCGIIVLKRLSDAIKDNDRILALLRGSAVTQDGRTNSITTPSSLSQQAAIRQALTNSQIAANSVSYIETHGTGTSLGDLIEVEALSSVFANQPRSIILGAVKTNIGHLEGASGIASLIKTILALQNESIPANLHLKTPNSQINWQNLPFKLPYRTIPWFKTSQPRIAGVSAFGFSGTNAHVIVAEAPETEIEEGINRQLHLFTLSARNEMALRELVADYVRYLQLKPDLAIEDICFTVNTGRAQFNHRIALIVSSTEDLCKKLTKFIDRETVERLWQGKINSNRDRTSVIDLELTDNWQEKITKLAEHYINGIDIDWLSIDRDYRHRKISLPTYPFQRQIYWMD